jgi:glutathione S-transferase
MTNGVRLLGRSTSNNVQKILWLLDELGVPYEREDYGGPFGRTRDAAYLNLNPNGRIPTLLDGDFAVWESNAIMRYLARRFDAEHLYPPGLHARARCDQWLDWQNGSLSPVMSPLYIGLVRTSPEKRDEAALDQLRARAHELFSIADRRLQTSPFMAGDGFTLVDIAVGPMAYRWKLMGLGDPDLQALERWYQQLAERAPFQEHVMVPLV